MEGLRQRPESARDIGAGGGGGRRLWTGVMREKEGGPAVRGSSRLGPDNRHRARVWEEWPQCCCASAWQYRSPRPVVGG